MPIISFIVNFVLSLIQFLFILRIILQMVKAPSNNELSTMLAQVTNPVIQPLRQFLPRTRFIDVSTLAVWVAIDIIKYIALVYLKVHVVLTAFQLILLVPADFIMQVTIILFYATLFHAVLNLVAAGMVNPATEMLKILANPLLEKIRQFFPDIGGFDLSPIIVLFLLKVIQMTITTYIPGGYFF